MKFLSKDQSILSKAAALLCCLLIFSFGLHTIQVEHTHPGDHVHTADQAQGENSLSTYMHGTDKKLFLLAVLAFLLIGTLVRTQYSLLEVACTCIRYITICYLSKRSTSLRFFNYLRTLFSSGVLHPKTY